MLVAVGMPVHDRDCAPEARRVGGFHDLEPLRGLDLVGADHRTDLVVEELSPAAFSPCRKSGTVRPRVLAPCQTSSGEKAWMWTPGTTSLIAWQMAR